jgi:hypothetical protein
VTISGLFGLFGSLVIGDSLARSLMQASRGGGYQDSSSIIIQGTTHSIQYSSDWTPLATSIYDIKQSKTNTPSNNSTSQC